MAATVPPGVRVPAPTAARHARSIVVEGVVQGVGFRPFVWRLATELGLAGRVRNTAGRVEIEAGGSPALDTFAARLATAAPPRAHVERVASSASSHRTCPDRSRSTRASAPPPPTGCSRPISPPATMPRRALRPADRRYRYAFTNCTNCGPRATIIDELPYDRARTTMRAFPLCEACAPSTSTRPPSLPRRAGRLPGLRSAPRLASETAAPRGPGRRVRTRWAAAGDPGRRDRRREGTRRLPPRLRRHRRRGGRPPPRSQAPLGQAVRGHGRDVAAAARLTRSARRAGLLTGPARPIVLLVARPDGMPASPRPSPRHRRLGLFLPYTPLHHLLLRRWAGRSSSRPATSPTSRSRPTTATR